jgi:histidine triad (HIT) family protein
MNSINKCVFCEIISGNIKARKLYETEHSIAILDAFPLKDGHSLIISKSHKPKIQDLSLIENRGIFETLHFLTEKIEKSMNCNSSLVGIHNGKDAGQEIPHFHIHVIPIAESDERISIHSLFDKRDTQATDLDEQWGKISKEIQRS